MILLLVTCRAQIPAFPGARGAGMYTSGGRGGQVFFVNTLADDLTGDPSTKRGTLRWCLEQQGARTILFEVCGTINLTTPLRINKGDLTIAGQSAPTPGICIAGQPVSLDASNVIIRYLRFRMGDRTLSPKQADGADAFGGRQQTQIIIDHCSISWGTDECSSFYDNKNFTMQWCIISESLRLSGHSKGPHGYGAIWGGRNASFHHNLLAHHDSRVPRLGPGAKYAGTDTVEMVNNVFYNWNGNGCYGGEAMHVNILNNTYKAGPATQNRVASQIVAVNASGEHGAFKEIEGIWGKYCVQGNFMSASEQVTKNNWEGVKIVGVKDQQDIRLATPLDLPGTLEIEDPRTAFTKVLNGAGCSLYRDAVDKRIVQETSSGTAAFQGRSAYNGQGGKWKSATYPRKGLIDSQEDLNPDPKNTQWSAWPVLERPVNLANRSHQGIPERWMEKNAKGKKGNDVNPDGYTVLETYLNSIIDN